MSGFSKTYLAEVTANKLPSEEEEIGKCRCLNPEFRFFEKKSGEVEFGIFRQFLTISEDNLSGTEAISFREITKLLLLLFPNFVRI